MKNLNQIRLLTLLTYGLFLICATPADAQKPNQLVINLEPCVENSLGVKFLCSRDWAIHKSENSVALDIFKQSNSLVRISVSRTIESGLQQKDLIPSALQYVYGYADGFRYNKVRNRYYRAIQIHAKPMKDPNGNYLDYFFIFKGKAYRVSFYTKSDALFRTYKPLFKRIIRSFAFIEPQPIPAK